MTPRFFRLRTPDGTAVSCRTEGPYGSLYLSVGVPGRLALTRDDAWASIATLKAALASDGEEAPDWSLLALGASGPGGSAPDFTPARPPARDRFEDALRTLAALAARTEHAVRRHELVMALRDVITEDWVASGVPAGPDGYAVRALAAAGELVAAATAERLAVIDAAADPESGGGL